MSLKLALKIVFLIALVGVLFSGVLTYKELFGPAAVSCPAPGAPGTVLGYPACVYGLFIYATLLIVSGYSLLKSK